MVVAEEESVNSVSETHMEAEEGEDTKLALQTLIVVVQEDEVN